MRQDFIEFWQRHGFEQIAPLPVIPPKEWTNTFFVNSGLIRYIEMARTGDLISRSVVVCQPCIKLGTGILSLEKMTARDGYFTFFEQLSCGGGTAIPIPWFIERTWEYLTEIDGLSPKKIYLGIHPSQPEVAGHWIRAGAKPVNICFHDQKAITLFLQNGAIQGIYNSSLYFDRGIDHDLACKKMGCDINCSCERFLKIGDMGIIRVGATSFIDHGIGLERILAAKQNLHRITDIKQFSEILSILIKSTPETNGPPLLLLADHLRSTIILLNSGLKPGNKEREYMLRKLVRRTFRLFSKSNSLQVEKIISIYRQISSKWSEYIPYLEISEETIIAEISAELQRYQILLTKGKKILEKFFKKRGTNHLSGEDTNFLYDTYGLPPEIVNELIK